MWLYDNSTVPMIVKAKSCDMMLRVLVVENLLAKMPASAKCFALVILVNLSFYCSITFFSNMCNFCIR